MNNNNQTDFFLQIFMERISKAILGNSKRVVNYLRYGTKDAIQNDMAKNILLALNDTKLSESQLKALESAFVQEEEHLIAWIFEMLDQGIPIDGCPEKVSLVNMDSNEEIYPGKLQERFTHNFIRQQKNLSD